jgi:tetratricopeptide (TPR) repeat protein
MTKQVLDNYCWIVTTSGNLGNKHPIWRDGITLIRKAPDEERFEGVGQLSTVKYNNKIYKESNFIRYPVSRDSSILDFLQQIQAMTKNIPSILHVKSIELGDLGKIHEARSYLHQADGFLPGAKDDIASREHLLVKLIGPIEALDFYNKILEDDAYNLSALINKAFLLFVLGEEEEAINCFDESLYLGNDRWNFYINKGSLLTLTGKFWRAIEYYNKALPWMPDYANKLNLISCKAYCFHQLGKLDDAMICFTMAESSFVIRDIYFYYYKGNLLSDIGDKEGAIKYYDIAESRGLNIIELFVNKGYLLQSLGRYTEALEYYNKVLNIRPSDLLALENKLHITKLIELEKESEQLIILAKKNRACSYQKIGNLAKCMGNNEEALDFYNQAENLGLNTPQFYMGKAKLYKAQGLLKEALECYNKALKITPHDLDLIEKKSIVLKMINEADMPQSTQELAMQHTERVQSFVIYIPDLSEGEDIDAFELPIIEDFYKLSNNNVLNLDNDKWSRGIALIHDKDFKEASECFKELVEIEYPNSYGLFQFIQCKLFNKKNALTFLESVEDSLKHDRDFQYIKGVELYLLGRSQDAIKCFDLAERAGLSSKVFYLDKGCVLTDLMKIDEAISLYNKILAKDRHNEVAIYHKACLLYLIGKSQEAKECFNERYYFGDNHNYFYYYKALFLTVTGHFNESILYYDKALERLSNSHDSYRLDAMSCKAYSLHRSHKLDEATSYFELVEQFSRIQNINITDPYFYYCKGNLLQDIGRQGEAFKYYNIAEHMGLCSTEFYNTIGDLYRNFNELETALAYYNKALDLDPQNLIVLQNKLQLLDEIDSPDTSELINTSLVLIKYSKEDTMLEKLLANIHDQYDL